MNNKLLTTIAILSPLLLSGCGSAEDDLHEWMASEAVKLKGQVAPLPAVSPFTPIAYVGRSVPDPFAPKKITKVAANAPDAQRRKDFLETFPIDQLAIVGTIKRKGTLWGLVRAPDGVISMVKDGDYIGQNFGQITTIKYSGVKIKESVLDPQGEWVMRDVELPVLNAK